MENSLLHWLRKAWLYLRALLKWLALAAVTGLACGLVGTAFHKGIDFVTELRLDHPWLLWLLPAAGLAIAGFYHLTKTEGKGTDDVIDAVHAGKPLPILLLPAIFLGTVLTHLCGGSAGREGAALQMGGTLGYHTGRLFRLDDRDMRTATLCGMAAFFSALFGTPLAATMFSIMVISVGVFYHVAFVPCFTASVVAYGVSLLLGVAPTRFRVTVPEIDPWLMVRVALLAARGFSLWEIGLAESVFHVVSLLCEVPSGMAADLLGRKKTLVSGGVCMVLQSLLMAFASDLFTICFAMGLNALAMTMFSGTSTALLYDSLKQEGCEENYIQVSANGSQISMLANAIGSMASILNQFLGYAGFYLLNAAFEGASALANMLLAEPIVTESQASREKHPLRALPEQFRQLVRDSLHVLHTCPMAVKLIASSALISVPSYLTKMFLQQRLVELGWPTELLFLPLLLGGLACVAGTEIGRRVRCRSMRRLYTVCALLCGVGTLLVGAAPAWGGILGMMLVQGVLEVYLLHESQKLNDAIPSDQRATLISVDGMAYSLLMIPASPLVGAVGDAFGQAGAGLALLGGIIVLSGVALLGKKPQES